MDVTGPTLNHNARRVSIGSAGGNDASSELVFKAQNLIVAQLPQPVFITDSSFKVVLANQAFSSLLQLPMAEIHGKTELELFPGEIGQRFQAQQERASASKQKIIVDEIIELGGKKLRLRAEKSPVLGASGEVQGVLTIFTSVRESNQNTDFVGRSDAELTRVWEKSLDGMRLTDEDGIILRVNPAFCRMVGKTQQELVGKSFAVIYDADQPENIVAKHRVRFAERNVEPLFERELLLWNGTKVWFELSNSFIEETGGRPYLLSIFRDISERKNAEEKLREFTNKLERSNRELQDFAYVASHDLQEPLRKVSVFSDRLKTKFGEQLGTEGIDYLDRMQKAAQRMQALINDLLTFSRVTSKSQPFVPVNLSKVAGEVVSDLETRIEQVGGKVEIASLPTIEAEPLHMRQLLQNLIGNALKFHRSDVKPLVRVEAHTFKEYHPAARGGTREMLQLTVSDNGIGFDEKYSEKIFQVFQRLHSRAQYEGTGMGLAITRKIVEHHGGQVTAKSKPNEGATFVVILPVQQLKQEQHEESR